METLITMIPTFSAFFSIFCLIYLVGYFIIFRHWNPTHRPDAASCLISIAHGTPAVLLAAVANLSHPAPNLFSAPNTQFQNLALEFSTAYFAVDLLHYLLLVPGDRLFIAHHLATLFVFLTCRCAALHGASPLLALLVLAESTSFCQNVWTLAGIRKGKSPIAARIYNSLSPLFYSLYTVMRVLIGPVFYYKMSAFYLSGAASDVIPMWVSVSWVVVIGAAIAASILWVWNNWVELFRERKQSGDKRKR